MRARVKIEAGWWSVDLAGSRGEDAHQYGDDGDTNRARGEATLALHGGQG